VVNYKLTSVNFRLVWVVWWYSILGMWKAGNGNEKGNGPNMETEVVKLKCTVVVIRSNHWTGLLD